MRAAVLLVALLTAPASAQWTEGVAALVPVDAYDRPADDRVWTDMRPLAFKASDEELQAATGATLYAGPAPGTLSAEAWRGRYIVAGRVDCENDATVCTVRVVGEGTRAAWLFPFGARIIRVPPATRMRVVRQLRLTDAQAEAVLVDWLLEQLVLGDGNALTSSSDGAALITTRPGASTCGDPTVQCGVVFEVEATNFTLGLLLL